MRSRAAAAVLIGLAAISGAGRAAAHESWLEPTAFEVEQGRPIGVHVCVADEFEGWSLARDPWRIASFVAIGDAGAVPVIGLDGADPAGIVRLAEPGGYVIAYRSHRAFLRVPAAEFEAFLREKGLDDVIRRRAERRPHAATTREAYSRHSKALVSVGGATGAPADRKVGMALELIAEDGLAAPESGARTFRLLYRGKPLANALVVATRLGTADREIRARTGADGRVRFPLRDDGLWRVAAVHMVEAPRDSGADWESLWASLTFELPPAAGETAERHALAQAACTNRLAPNPPAART